MTTNNNSITTLLDLIAEGNSSPKEFLQKIDPYQLSRIIYPRFHGTPDHVLCKGLPIQSGDVNGILVLGKDVANAIATNKLNKQDTPSYVYSTPGGDVSDFSARLIRKTSTSSAFCCLGQERPLSRIIKSSALCTRNDTGIVTARSLLLAWAALVLQGHSACPSVSFCQTTLTLTVSPSSTASTLSRARQCSTG